MDHIGAAFASRTMICRIFSVYLPLTELPGVGRKTGKGLYAAGTRTREDWSAELEALMMPKASLAEGQRRCMADLHSDDGSAMKGATMLLTLEKLGLVPSFSSPRVSNGNRFPELQFRMAVIHEADTA